MKKSFVLYTEQREIFKKMSDDQAGKLIKAIYQYVETGNLDNIDEITNIIITPFVTVLDKDAEKYEETKKKKAEAGKKGMQKRWKDTKRITEDNSVITSITNDNTVITDITQDNTTKQEITKITDNEYVYDNVNDNTINGINKEKNTKKRKVFQKPTIEEIQQYCTDRNNSVDPERFYDFYESKGWKVGKEPMKDWKACVRTWEKNDNKPVQRNDKKGFQNYEQREIDDIESFYDNI